MKEKAAISTQAQTAATNGQLMTKNAFVVTVKCGSSRFCLVSADAREACIEAEHYIRNVFGLGALVLEISGAAPETTRIICNYLSNLRGDFDRSHPPKEGSDHSKCEGVSSMFQAASVCIDNRLFWIRPIKRGEARVRSSVKPAAAPTCNTQRLPVCGAPS
jgi:hypothetical protein